ncbi:MAG: peptidoglycan-binding protein [Ketobacteraceae bacterium]|nr:peptidoglycan-binding protein [Ketobacteraceae bacterium]
MKLLVMVDATPYELISNKDSHLISKAQGKVFHYREHAHQFSRKIIDQNLDAVNQIKSLLQVPSGDGQPHVAETLAEKLFLRQLTAQLGPGGSGLRNTRPPSVKARAKPPEASDAVMGSTLLSHSMRAYLKKGVDNGQSAGQAVSANVGTTTSAGTSASEKGIEVVKGQGPRDYQVVVEIAGRSLSSKQSIELLCGNERPVKKYSSNDHRSEHRSLCRFSNLENTPVDLTLAIPVKGQTQPMRLPLATGVVPSARGTDKPVWDNLLVPVKPLQFLNEHQQKAQADILQHGWLYVFWKGRLWRELAVNRHSALSDVNLSFYRSTRDNNRAAEGHWLDAVWVPYLIKGEVQTDLLLAASPVQWSWTTIERMEADSALISESSATLDALSAYTESRSFSDSAVTSGAIVSATAVSSAGKKHLQRQQRQRISTAYLPKTSARLTVQLTDQRGKPWSNADVVVTLKGTQTPLKADASGCITVHVPADCDKSDLKVAISPDIPEQSFNARLNQLDAVDTVAGLQARLNNLGLNAGPVDGIMGRKTKAATKKFQSAHGLAVDGISGPKTQQKLTEIHQS